MPSRADPASRGGSRIRTPALASLGGGGFWRKPEAATASAPETWRALKVYRDPRPRLVVGVAPAPSCAAPSLLSVRALADPGLPGALQRCFADPVNARAHARQTPGGGFPCGLCIPPVASWASQFPAGPTRVPHPHLPAPPQFPVAYRGAFVSRLGVGNLVLLFLMIF